MYDLVVTRPFGAYKVGDRITDPKTVIDVLAEYRGHVVQVPAADPVTDPAPADRKKK